MDSSFVNYDGRSVHDMIEALLAMSGDPEAIRRLQESINEVDKRAQSSIAVVNAAIDQLDADKQDAGYYTENGGGVFGTTARFNDGASVGKFVQGQAVKGIRIYGQHTTDSQGYKGESLVFNTDTKTIKQYVQDSSDDSWSEKAVYSADEDTGWITLVPGLTYRKKNGFVTVKFDMNTTIGMPDIAAGQWVNFNADNRLPTDCRPSATIVLSLVARRMTNDDYDTNNRTQIDTSGVINIQSFTAINSTTHNSLGGAITYPI